MECMKCGKETEPVNMRYGCLECSREETVLTGPWALFLNTSVNKKDKRSGRWLATTGVLPVWVYDDEDVDVGDHVIVEIKAENSPHATIYKVSEKAEKFIGHVVKRINETNMYLVLVDYEYLVCVESDLRRDPYEGGEEVTFVLTKGGKQLQEGFII